MDLYQLRRVSSRAFLGSTSPGPKGRQLTPNLQFKLFNEANDFLGGTHLMIISIYIIYICQQRQRQFIVDIDNWTITTLWSLLSYYMMFLFISFD